MSVSSALEMSVVQAPIQTVEEVYGPVWAAVANKQPFEAICNGRPSCLVRTDWTGISEGSFACLAISTEVKAKVGSSRQLRLQTGVVWRWNNSAE